MCLCFLLKVRRIVKKDFFKPENLKKIIFKHFFAKKLQVGVRTNDPVCQFYLPSCSFSLSCCRCVVILFGPNRLKTPLCLSKTFCLQVLGELFSSTTVGRLQEKSKFYQIIF